MPDQLYDLTFRDFAHMLEGFNERMDAEYKRAFEAARFTAVLVIGSFSGKPIYPDEVYRFPWEQKRKIKIMSPERFEQFKKAFEKLEHGKVNPI